MYYWQQRWLEFLHVFQKSPARFFISDIKHRIERKREKEKQTSAAARISCSGGFRYMWVYFLVLSELCAPPPNPPPFHLFVLFVFFSPNGVPPLYLRPLPLHSAKVEKSKIQRSAESKVLQKRRELNIQPQSTEQQRGGSSAANHIPAFFQTQTKKETPFFELLTFDLCCCCFFLEIVDVWTTHWLVTERTDANGSWLTRRPERPLASAGAPLGLHRLSK